MPNDNTHKEQKEACSGALNKPGVAGKEGNSKNKGKQGKGPNSEKSEGLKEFVFEIDVKQSKIGSTNNFKTTEAGPVAQDLEIERREEYNFKNYLR